MKKPTHLLRINISLVLLVVFPWTTVLTMTLRVALLPAIPKFEPQDEGEILALERALEGYAQKYGEYPPDFTSGNPRREIDEHLKEIFPGRDAELDIPACVDDLGPDNALAFWLQGFYNHNTTCPLTGKIYLGRHPETNEEVWVQMSEEEIWAEVYEGDSVAFMTSKGITRGGVEDIKVYDNLLFSLKDLREHTPSMLLKRRPLYAFDRQRLSKRGGYYARCCDAPYVYFRAKSYSAARFDDRTTWGVAKPYQAASADGKIRYVRPAGFQLICAGRDSFFGLDSVAVANAVDCQGYADNFTNFAPNPLGIRAMTLKQKQSFKERRFSLMAAAICIFAYPVFLALRCREDGLTALARITRKQADLMGCSESWRRELEVHRHHRRKQTLRRFRTTSTERTASAPPDVSKKTGSHVSGTQRIS